MLGVVDLLDNLADSLEIEAHVVVLEVRLNDLEVGARSSVIVELPELLQIDGTILVSIVLIEDVLDAHIFLRARCLG